MKSTTMATIFLIGLTGSALAQPQQWEEGRIVTLNNDTLEGEVQFPGGGGLTFIRFWKYSGEPGNLSVYTACDILSFKKGESEFTSLEYGDHFLFARRMVSGMATLYEVLYDPAHYGRAAIPGEAEEAGFRTSGSGVSKHLYLLELPGGRPELISRTWFANTMKKRLAGCPDAVNSLDAGHFNYNQLPRLITFYNECPQCHSTVVSNL